MPVPWNIIIPAAVSIIGGISSSSAQVRGGQAARDVAYQNAEAMLELAYANSGRMTQIAGINASAIRNVGYANAANIERTAIRNSVLTMIEGKETLRRHVREEQYSVGLIRTMQASTGWSVNEGTPQIYKESQKAEMLFERNFIANQSKLIILTNLLNEGDRAGVQRYAADQQAGALLASAAIEREITLAEAMARFDAMRREGDLLAQTGQASGTSSLISGLLTGAGILAGHFAT